MKIMKRLMIAISSANNIGITRACLKTIPPGPKVIMYDDASTEPIKHLCSEFRIGLKKEIKPKGLTNLWNRAYSDFLISGMPYLLMTNNDVLFAKGSIEEMLTLFAREMPDILGPLTNKPGTGKDQKVDLHLPNIDIDIHNPANFQTIQDMLMARFADKFLYHRYINGFCYMIGRSVNRYRRDSMHLFPPEKINIGNEDWLCGQIRRGNKNSPEKKFIICLTSFVFHYKGLTTRWCKKTSTVKGVNRQNLWREV